MFLIYSRTAHIIVFAVTKQSTPRGHHFNRGQGFIKTNLHQRKRYQRKQ